MKWVLSEMQFSSLSWVTLISILGTLAEPGGTLSSAAAGSAVPGLWRLLLTAAMALLSSLPLSVSASLNV